VGRLGFRVGVSASYRYITSFGQLIHKLRHTSFGIADPNRHRKTEPDLVSTIVLDLDLPQSRSSDLSEHSYVPLHLPLSWIHSSVVTHSNSSSVQLTGGHGTSVQTNLAFIHVLYTTQTHNIGASDSFAT